jgi:c-di-GMP-binding flagellar brake protein YcgR
MDMPETSRERRQFPRSTVAGGHELKVPLQMAVQLLDISTGGMLVVAPQPLEPGARAELQTRLGADPVQVELEVRWVAPDGEPVKSAGRYRLGARLITTEETRRGIQKFLRDKSLY